MQRRAGRGGGELSCRSGLCGGEQGGGERAELQEQTMRW